MEHRTFANEITTKNAGEFSVWLNDFVRTMEGRISVNVPYSVKISKWDIKNCLGLGTK